MKDEERSLAVLSSFGMQPPFSVSPPFLRTAGYDLYDPCNKIQEARGARLRPSEVGALVGLVLGRCTVMALVNSRSTRSQSTHNKSLQEIRLRLGTIALTL